MNNNIRILIRNSFLFMLPIISWIIVVIIVDPFNYFNLSNKISEKSKLESAQNLNSLLYNVIYLKNNPTKNIIIGDSRIRKLPTDEIKVLSGNDYYILHANAVKLNEIIDLFWLANDYEELENVIIGINFNLYNEYAYSDRVTVVEELINNPLIYIFNWDVLETTCLSLKNEFLPLVDKRKRDGKKFWQYTLNTTAKNQYSKWKEPISNLDDLKKVSDYCKQSNINLTLLITPHHKDFHDKLLEYKLYEEEINFKNQLRGLARVVDYDYSNSITNCRECFGDPIHTSDSISKVIVTDLFGDSLTIGREIK